jgi:hypothetical protein
MGTNTIKARVLLDGVTVQVRGARTCLEVLGPWPAAAAAHLDLLRAMADSDAADADGAAGGSSDEDDDGARAAAAAAKCVQEGQDNDEEAALRAGARWQACWWMLPA